MLLSLVMLVALVAGCGQAQNGDTTATTAAPTAGSTAAESEPAVQTDKVTTLDVFIDQNWWPVKEFKGIIPEEITKKTGVAINLTVAADANQLGVMIASAELPDMVVAADGAGNLDRLSNANLCIDYDGLFSQTGVPFVMDDTRKNIARSYSTDGKYYMILSQFGTTDEVQASPIGAPGQPCVFYRQDMYEKLGSPKMDTIEDFLKVCDMVKKQLPGVTPLGLGGWWKFQNFSAWLGGAGANAYQPLEDGSVVYKTSSPAYKDYLKFANTCYQKGYITAEDYAEDNEGNSHAKAYSGKFFAYPWYLDSPNLTQLQSESAKIDPNAKWTVLKPLGKPTYNIWAGWLGMFVSKNCKDMTAAAKLISLLESPDGQLLSYSGREGVDFTLDANGIPQYTQEFLDIRKDSAKFNEVYNNWFDWGVGYVTQMKGGFSGLDQNLLDLYGAYRTGWKNYPEVAIANPKSNTDEGAIYSKLEELWKSEEAKAVFAKSDSEFETKYAEIQKVYQQNGVDTLNAYMTKTAKEVKAKFGF
jgi:putative aldouronate transport system substrate-binding protein